MMKASRQMVPKNQRQVQWAMMPYLVRLIMEQITMGSPREKVDFNKKLSNVSCFYEFYLTQASVLTMPIIPQRNAIAVSTIKRFFHYSILF